MFSWLTWVFTLVATGYEFAFHRSQTQMLGPTTNACFAQKELFVDSRPGSISTRRQRSEPTSRNRKNQETCGGASMEKPAGRRHDEVPKLSLSRSTNFSPDVPERHIQDTKLGGAPTRLVCRRDPLLPQRRLPVLSGRHVRRGVPAEQTCVFEKKSAVFERALKRSARSLSHLHSTHRRAVSQATRQSSRSTRTPHTRPSTVGCASGLGTEDFPKRYCRSYRLNGEENRNVNASNSSLQIGGRLNVEEHQHHCRQKNLPGWCRVGQPTSQSDELHDYELLERQQHAATRRTATHRRWNHTIRS